jgi:hypothetical protein
MFPLMALSRKKKESWYHTVIDKDTHTTRSGVTHVLATFLWLLFPTLDSNDYQHVINVKRCLVFEMYSPYKIIFNNFI